MCQLDNEQLSSSEVGMELEHLSKESLALKKHNCILVRDVKRVVIIRISTFKLQAG